MKLTARLSALAVRKIPLNSGSSESCKCKGSSRSGGGIIVRSSSRRSSSNTSLTCFCPDCNTSKLLVFNLSPSNSDILAAGIRRSLSLTKSVRMALGEGKRKGKVAGGGREDEQKCRTHNRPTLSYLPAQDTFCPTHYAAI